MGSQVQILSSRPFGDLSTYNIGATSAVVVVQELLLFQVSSTAEQETHILFIVVQFYYLGPIWRVNQSRYWVVLLRLTLIFVGLVQVQCSPPFMWVVAKLVAALGCGPNAEMRAGSSPVYPPIIVL